MTVEPRRVRYTPAEYLALERAAETRSEYLDGEIIAMTGASFPHNVIVVNLSAGLQSQMRGSGCRALTNDMRVKVSNTGLYTYPDVVVACPPFQFEDASGDTLLNPVVIIEVLSPTTEAYDRGEKFHRYRGLESLREYVLVAQDKPRIERFVRQGELWLFSVLTGLDAVLSLDAIGCRIALNDVYDGVPGFSDGGPTTPLEAAPSELC